MSCNSPVVINVNGVPTKVSCNYCAGCRMTRISEWSERIKHECQEHAWKGNESTFLLLTYDNEHVPACGVCKRDVQLFLKRLRKYFSDHHIIKYNGWKYFLVSEYGDKEARPHYHAIMMGLPFDEVEPIYRRCWPNGFVFSRPVADGGIRYVLKYMQKSRPKKQEREIYDKFNFEPPFCMMSKGIGLNWYIRHQTHIINNGGYYCKSRLVKPNAYFKRKFGMFGKVDKQLLNQMEERARRSNMTVDSYDYSQRIAREEHLRISAMNKGDLI